MRPTASASSLTLAGLPAATLKMRPLAPGAPPGGAVDRGARREDDAPDVLVAWGEEDVERALDVDGARGERILDRARHRAERAEMEDGLDAAPRRVDALVAAQLALDDLDVELFEVVSAARGEVVEDADVVA